MRSTCVTGLIVVAALAACRSDQSTVAPPAPSFSHVQDLDGTPDLIVDSKRLADSWVVYDQTFDAGVCSVVEGGDARRRASRAALHRHHAEHR
ncbi:MAG TPA: hypothetical protein VI139_03985 [Gemmatimonadales bacterium]